MSSSEEYLDSLLDSILGGGKSENSEGPADEVNAGESQTASEENRASAEAGKAMSPEEIEEMLVSMGTLGGGEEEAPESEEEPEFDMDAMRAFMDEHNAEVAAAAEEQSLDALLSDQFSLDDLTVDDAGQEEDSIGDLSLDDLSLDELSLDDSTESDLGQGDFSLDDLSLDDTGREDSLTDDFSLDDLSLDELALNDSTESDLGQGDFSLDDLSLDDMDMGETSIDDLSLDDMSMGEASIDDLSLDDMGMEMDDSSIDDLSLDELSLDDLSLEDGLEFGLGQEDSALDEAGEESSTDDFSLDDFSLDDLSLEETGADEAGMGSDMEGLMSEEDIDRLLSGDLSTEEEGMSEDFALEDTGEDDDLSALLAGMDHDDDLSEINDLLEESQQGGTADDDLLAMLEGTADGGDDSFDFFESDEAAREAESIRELSPEEIAARESGEEKPKKEKKKRKKLFGKKKADAEETAVEEPQSELDRLLEEASEPKTETAEQEKKPGFFARLMNLLLESDEDDEDLLSAEALADDGSETGTVTDENRQILEELDEEDKKGKKKKKKDKKKKGKKGNEGEGEGEEEAEGEGEESGKKAKKRKKKKKKEEMSEEELLAPPEKKLSRKKVITVFLFCATMAACIILLSSFLPNYMQKRDAHVAYDHRQYDDVYDLLYGKKRNEQDEIMFQRSNLILQMNRKLASYENYVNLNMPLEALNALVSGVARYQEILPEAEHYNVVGEVSDIYAQILERLSMDFGVSESDAMEIIILEDDVVYTQWLEAIINGALYGEEDESGARQDMLPEEEEIMERLEGLEEE